MPNGQNTSNKCQNYIDTSKSTNFQVISTWYFQFNFDGLITGIISMYFFYTISMDGKSTLHRLVSFDMFLGKKLWSFSFPFLLRVRYFKNESCLAVFFRCNLILMYFFKVISFHLELSKHSSW